MYLLLIKVSNKLVDTVLNELNSKVLQHMPLTNLKKLHFKMRADPTLASYLDEESEFPVSLTLSMSYRSLGSSES